MLNAEDIKPKQEYSLENLEKAEIYPLAPNGNLPENSPMSDASSCSNSAVEPTCIAVVLTKIRQDVLACDLLWSLFISSLLSYRRDTVLRPFPQKYCDDGDDADVLPSVSGFKNFEKLKIIASRVPALTFLLSELSERDTNQMNSCESIELLAWTLNTKTFSLETVDKSMFAKIKELTGQVADAPTPTHIFQIKYNNAVDLKFEGKELIYAYHGSRVENFHSILHNGLCNHMNKNSLFGEGTYLSSDLSVCMPYSPTGLGWSKSHLGDRISCIAVCEVINHPDVKCQIRKANNKQRVPGIRPGDILGDGIPEKYYIVQNDELVRIKYLLVYAEKCNSNSQSFKDMDPQPRNWILQYRFIIVMTAYLLVLLAVGIGDSRSWKSVLRKFTSWFN